MLLGSSGSHPQKTASPFPTDNLLSEQFRGTHLTDGPLTFSGLQLIEQDEPFNLNHMRIKVMLISMCFLPIFFRRIRNPYAFELVAFVFLFLLTGCASTAQRPSKAFPYQTANEIERNIRSYVRHWEGTPHRLGGTGRKGVDCSGFIMLAYYRLFDIQLPRSTSEQVKTGRQISRRSLRAGDIVFFLLPEKKRHVGIYLSRGEFAHVSSSKGVTISNLHDTYWRRAYWTARRILSL
jgi:hypothetical protein